VLFTRLVVEPPPLLDVELTRDEVERFYRAHINDYSVQELVRVRHILISPTGPGADADAAARRKAEDILKRARAGEDFVRLAAEFSDDPATRDGGGDVGVFRHGQMREGFERAAFAMRAGDITGPVRTEVGYHVMECLEYVPATIHPIAQVYANVAHDCALKKANRLAGQRADSIYKTLKSVADAKAVARRLHLEIMAADHRIGQYGLYDLDLRPYIKKLETLEPGQLYPGTQLYIGLGQVISWVDSIVPPRLPSWEEAKGQAVERYRRQVGERALLGKKAELDSMLAGGWSLDSLAMLWGGLEKSQEAPAGSELRGLGGRSVLDSLVFGRERPPVLEPGQVSDWIDFPGGYSKLRVAERLAPDPEDLARRVELRRQLVLWRKLNEYFDRLKARYPVEILDGELRATALPEPTES
jgi:peptidyl-prolyl cis-trans isomerase D